MNLALSSLLDPRSLRRSPPPGSFLVNTFSRPSDSRARKSREPSDSRDFRARGFTLVELSVVIAVILVLAGAASMGIKPYYAYQDGRAAGEALRAVKAAQMLYLADYPLTAVTSLTQTLLLPYMPNGTWPTLPMIGNVRPTINCAVFPPVALLSGATYPAASPAPTDGLWNVGQY